MAEFEKTTESRRRSQNVWKRLMDGRDQRIAAFMSGRQFEQTIECTAAEIPELKKPPEEDREAYIAYT